MTEKTPGRPRDAAVSRKLKDTALRLVRDKGYDTVPISAIIAEAGVSRQSLYNRWSTKAELVLDAFYDDSFTRVAQPLPRPDHRGALATFLADIFAHLAENGAALRSLIAAAQADETFRVAFHDRFVAPREEIVTQLLHEAQAAGELPPGRDPELLSAFVHGAFWYRLLNGQTLDDTWARRIADGVFGP
ncbi:MAG: TetR family transcriptional regulator [Rhodobacteraceae bacterium]|nr:TetR family transcriptional regulator [Paracoccaceae bacterium]